MWLLLAFLSATLLGFYDVFKKQSLKDNAVLPVLFLNTFFSSLVFLPFAKYQHRSDKHHYRTSSIDRSHDSDRKVFHPKIPEYP